MDALNFNTAGELIGTELNADSVLNVSQGRLNAFALNAAIVIDCLWFLHNKVVHDDERVDSGKLVASIRRRYAGHANAWLRCDGSVKLRWLPPKDRWLKLNSDVTIRPNGSLIAIPV